MKPIDPARLDAEQRAAIAASLEAHPDLLPYLAELLADVPVLGCDPAVIGRLLRSRGFGGDARLLDLACGKGAVALEAARLGMHALGIDLFEPFLEEARSRARELGLEERVRFVCQDLRCALAIEAGHDAVVYASVGVLGEIDRAIGELRRVVRPGGVLIVDDGYLTDPRLTLRPGYEHYHDRAETRRRLTSRGDRLLEEVTRDPARERQLNRTTTEAIRRRAVALVHRHPQDRERIEGYVARQEDECAALERGFTGATWMLERAR